MQTERFYVTTMLYHYIYIWRFALLTGQILTVTWHEFKQPVHTRCKCMCVVKRHSQIISRCFREANRNLYGVFTTCRASLNLLETAAKQTTSTSHNYCYLSVPGWGFPPILLQGAQLMHQHDVSCLPLPLIYVFGVIISQNLGCLKI